MKPSVNDLLRRVSLFATLDEKMLAELAQECRVRRFEARKFVFHQDEPGNTLYIICSGRVNIQTVTPAGETMYITHRVAGDYFGEMALIDNKPRMADVETSEPCEMLTLNRDALLRCIEASPQVAFHMMAVLAERLREAANSFGNYQVSDVLRRVALALVERLETSAVVIADGKRLPARLTQQQIADEVHSSRETVNRALAQLKATEVIRMDGRAIVIINEQKLRHLCSH